MIRELGLIASYISLYLLSYVLLQVGDCVSADILSSSRKCTAVPWTARASTQSSRQTVASFYRHQSSSGAISQAINRPLLSRLL